MKTSHNGPSRLLVTGVLAAGIGTVGAYLCYEVGQSANSTTPKQLATAGESVKASVDDYLKLTPARSCARNVLATLINRQSIYQPPINTSSLNSAVGSVCERPIDDKLASEVVVEFKDVQMARQNYHEMFLHSQYPEGEKIAFAAGGFFGSLVVASALYVASAEMTR